jgi:hypothetical protein
MYVPLTNAEIREMLTSEMHGPPPAQTMSRVFASLAALAELRTVAEKVLKDCYPCGGTGRLLPDFDFSMEGGQCGACRELRQELKRGEDEA